MLPQAQDMLAVIVGYRGAAHTQYLVTLCMCNCAQMLLGASTTHSRRHFLDFVMVSTFVLSRYFTVYNFILVEIFLTLFHSRQLFD